MVDIRGEKRLEGSGGGGGSGLLGFHLNQNRKHKRATTCVLTCVLEFLFGLNFVHTPDRTAKYFVLDFFLIYSEEPPHRKQEKAAFLKLVRTRHRGRLLHHRWLLSKEENDCLFQSYSFLFAIKT